MPDPIMDAIKKEVEENPVLVYMKGTSAAPQCGFSAATVEVLRTYNVPFKDVNVLADPIKLRAVKIFSSWPTIPQVYIGGKFVGGCDILREMHAKGEIQGLLDEAGVTKS
jgi:monothiol glutaredoxin